MKRTPEFDRLLRAAGLPADPEERRLSPAAAERLLADVLSWEPLGVFPGWFVRLPYRWRSVAARGARRRAELAARRWAALAEMRRVSGGGEP